MWYFNFDWLHVGDRTFYKTLFVISLVVLMTAFYFIGVAVQSHDLFCLLFAVPLILLGFYGFYRMIQVVKRISNEGND